MILQLVVVFRSWHGYNVNPLHCCLFSRITTITPSFYLESHITIFSNNKHVLWVFLSFLFNMIINFTYFGTVYINAVASIVLNFLIVSILHFYFHFLINIKQLVRRTSITYLTYYKYGWELLDNNIDCSSIVR